MSGHVRRILVVDDCAVIRAATRIHLEGQGLEFAEAEDAGRALEVIGREPVDVVIADIDSKGLDGFALVAAIRTHKKESVRRVPVVLLTGDRGSARLREKALSAGAEALVSKPVSSSNLRALVAGLLAARNPFVPDSRRLPAAKEPTTPRPGSVPPPASPSPREERRTIAPVAVTTPGGVQRQLGIAELAALARKTSPDAFASTFPPGLLLAAVGTAPGPTPGHASEYGTQADPDDSGAFRCNNVVVFLTKSAANPFQSLITLGRAPNNDVVLPAHSVSNFHGYFTRTGSTWRFTDKGSSNGTTLDRRPLVPNVPADLSSESLLGFGPSVTGVFFTARELHEFASKLVN